MDLLQLEFPKYKGLESQYEHVIYNYLENVLKQNGYILKIKKTNFDNVDKNISSVSGNGNASCDAYVFSKNDGEGLYALIELESNEPKSKLKDGIIQIRIYAKSLSDKYKIGEYKTEYDKLKLVVYDGQQMYFSEYDLDSQNENIIIGSDAEPYGEQMDSSIKDRLFNNFPKITNDNYAKIEATEKRLIRITKEIIRANKSLQVNKAYLLTVLASIYGQTRKTNFNQAIQTLNNDAINEKKDAIEIKEKWEMLHPKIEYNKVQTQQKIRQLYEDVAIYLYIISQDKKLDLYGFIYEELAEKTNKKDDGEYYTPRHHIRPIINSVFKKYLKKKWGLTNNANTSFRKLREKVILDPFCGSGGFLYEFLKLLKAEYNLSNTQINNLANNALIGFDKNDVMAAYFNLFLIGDGKSKLYQVQSSINWQNIWKYVVKNGKVVELTSEEKLKESISSNIVTFKGFLSVLIDIEKVKEDFSIDDTNMIDIKTIHDFIEIDEELNNENIAIDDRYSFFDTLLLQSYYKDNNCVLKLMYDKFKSYSSNAENVPSFSEFLDNLGIVDYMATNVPYGNIDDIRFKNGYGSRLESVALKECIDLLKPSSYVKGYYEDNQFYSDENGEMFSKNDGGIATIVIPNGILERDEGKLREYLLKKCRILSLIKLPFYTFSPYALIQTFVITIQKKAVFEFNDTKQNQKVFFYIVDNDGKANSDKRYPTKLINSNRTEIKDKNGKIVTNVHEFIHDELEQNLEKYPEGYLSKLERAWIYGKTATVNDDWNQERYNETWNGEEWEKIKDTKFKWTYEKLKKKKYTKQVEKKSSKIADLIKQLVNENENFADLDLVEQKEQIALEIKRNYIEPITAVSKKEDKVTIEPKKIPNKTNLMNFIKENYDEDFEYDSSNIEQLKEELYTTNNLNFVKEVNDLFTVLEIIDDIFIDENGDATLYVNEEYEEHDLVPEHYLGETEKTLSVEEIIDNIRRLKNMIEE